MMTAIASSSSSSAPPRAPVVVAEAFPEQHQQMSRLRLPMLLFLVIGTAYLSNVQITSTQEYAATTRQANTGVSLSSDDDDDAPATSISRRPVSYKFIWDGQKAAAAASSISSQDEETVIEVSSSYNKQEGSTSSEHKDDDDRELPEIVWLASYPNSGTSYTMTMVERSTNVSTATNYGLEIAHQRDDSIPVHPAHPEGPFWEGLSGKRGSTIRDLPDRYVMTKTHCGGRCVNCPASEYVADAPTFLKACQKTSGYVTNPQTGQTGIHFYAAIDASRIAKVIHLIRNPFTNVVARYHLERRHLLLKNPELEKQYYPLDDDATGFGNWCRYMDQKYGDEEQDVLPSKIVNLMSQVPCRAEFFKYLQWHNRLTEIMSHDKLLFDNNNDNQQRVLVVHYENYETDLNQTVSGIMDFLQQQVVRPLRPFRELPTYAEHYSPKDRAAAKKLAKAVATAETWKLIRHYFE